MMTTFSKSGAKLDLVHSQQFFFRFIKLGAKLILSLIVILLSAFMSGS